MKLQGTVGASSGKSERGACAGELQAASGPRVTPGPIRSGKRRDDDGGFGVNVRGRGPRNLDRLSLDGMGQDGQDGVCMIPEQPGARVFDSHNIALGKVSKHPGLSCAS